MTSSRALLLSILLTTSFQITADESLLTIGVSNGKMWANLTQIDQLAAHTYVVAYIDALWLTRSKLIDVYMKCGCSAVDISNGVTSVYSWDPAYSRLPIGFAIEVAIRRATGVPKEDLVKFADEALRKLSAP